MSARTLFTSITVALCAVVCAVVCNVAPAAATELPDGRVYELVSSLGSYGAEVYQPEIPVVTGEYSNTATQYLSQASVDGNSVAFVGGPSVGGNESAGGSKGNEYLARRSAGGGWSQSNISAPASPFSFYRAFSSDLSTGVIDSIEPLSSTAPGFGEEPVFGRSYDVLYTVDLSHGLDFDPLFTVKPPYRSVQEFGTANEFGSERMHFAGASSDSRHLLFLANDALTGASEGRPAAEGSAASSFERKNNLYERFDGQLRLVNVLPDDTTHANATFGSGRPYSRAISSDGSRIFWTDLATGHIYVREDGSSTTEISSVGQYQTASSDGSVVFYTNGDLYEYELAGAHTTDLSPGVAVKEVIGASENGEYVYYVTVSGQLKLWHNGATTTIAAIPEKPRGRVTPDGHSIVFSGAGFSGPVYVYDAETGVLYCASCTTGGTKGFLPEMSEGEEYSYQPRWISADGSRAFFDSREGLVSGDANGVNDVYEWERPDSNGCTESTGCVHLLSGGTSVQNSYFVDASETGDDVFVVTRAKLLEGDDNELYDVYDVRVNGVSPIAPPACSGSGCQGVPGAPPIFATPSSVTFEGVGNFAAPVQEARAKPKSKPKSKHKPKKRRKGKSKAKKSARKTVARRRSGVKGGRS